MLESRIKPAPAGRDYTSSGVPRRKLLSLLVAHALSIPLAVQAATIEVTSTTDDGTGCTLREAIASINAGSDQSNGCSNTGSPYGFTDTIIFDSSVAGGTIVLGGTELDISSSVSVNPDGEQVTIDANSSSRVLSINTAGIDVQLHNLFLTNGYLSSDFEDGGGISISGAANLSIHDSTISGNTVQSNLGDGGGISAVISATVYLMNSIVTDNTASFAGGGIYANLYSSVTLENTTISDNKVTDDFAGGGGLGGSDSTFTLINSTVSGNIVTYQFGAGAGFELYQSSLFLTNSTISGNSATGDFGSGGGIDADESYVSMINTTMAKNFPEALYLDQNSSASLINSIVADTSNGESDCVKSVDSSVTAGTDNIIEIDDCSTSALNSNPDLAALADNGGPTRMPLS